MGFGTYANWADTVQAEFVAEQCPKEYQAFLDAIDNGEDCLEGIAYWLDEHQGLDSADTLSESQEEEIRSLYKTLQEAFEKQTGLTLEIRYHRRSDRGDSVDGAFWEVGKVWQYTSAAEKLKDKITRESWTDCD